MARPLFLLLLFANLAFFVWASGYLGRRDDGHEPGRLTAQLEPDRMRVSVPGVASAGTPAQPAAVLACRRVGPLVLAAAQDLKAALEEKAAARVVLTPIEEASYWVSIPPLAGKAAADKKAGELHQLGIGDYFVVSDPGPDRYAISLGLYHAEESAKDRLQQLAKKGVKSARIETKSRPAEKAWLDVRADPDLLGRQLPELLSTSAAEVAECPKE